MWLKSYKFIDKRFKYIPNRFIIFNSSKFQFCIEITSLWYRYNGSGYYFAWNGYLPPSYRFGMRKYFKWWVFVSWKLPEFYK